MLHVLKRITSGIAISASLFVAHPVTAQTLEIAAASENTQLMQALAAAFKAQHPDVTIRVPPGPRSEDDLAQALLRRSTVGDSLPDVLISLGNLRLLAEQGLALPLDPLLAKDAQPGIMKATTVVRERGRVGKQLYGVAFGISAPVILFNSRLLQEAGGAPDSPPTDWTGIFALARKIDHPGSPIIGGFMETDGVGSIKLLNLLQSQRGAMMNSDESTLTIDTPEGVAALDILRRFGEVGQARANMTRDQARAAFGAGTIGVLGTMSANIAATEKNAAGRFKVLSVPLPVLPGGSIAAAGPVASIVTRDPVKQALALQFINFTISPEGQLIVAKDSGYYPVNQTAIDRSTELATLLAGRPNSHSVLASLPVTKAWYTPPGTQAARIATITNDDLMRVAGLQLSPKAALKDMTERIAPLIPNAKQ